jgi:hypothetical protein
MANLGPQNNTGSRLGEVTLIGGELDEAEALARSQPNIPVTIYLVSDSTGLATQKTTFLGTVLNGVKHVTKIVHTATITDVT